MTSGYLTVPVRVPIAVSYYQDGKDLVIRADVRIPYGSQLDTHQVAESLVALLERIDADKLKGSDKPEPQESGQ